VSAISLIDWELAAATGARLAPPGPSVAPAEAAEIVADLAAAAFEAQERVSEVTELAGDPQAAPTVVVDRPTWVRGNVDGFRTVVEPLAAELLSRKSPPPAPLLALGSRVTGLQVGGLLAYLATRVLGQYEIFLPPGQGTGRLSLVAPNIVATERRLGLPPHDFRRWVAVHEVTHRTQFTAVPWLREHILSCLTEFVRASDLDPAALVERLKEAVSAAVGAARGDSELSLIELVQTPAQRAVLDKVTGLMSLVEGHAEYVMDRAAEGYIPTAEELRTRFDARRASANPLERVFRRLLGIEMKMRQYAEGARFVRYVVDAVGMPGFNRVWEAPDNLPGAGEIRAPELWLDRMGGTAAESA
jgi:coenzyme F420 biosynthesis associated uncharacterized protein